ncbi:YeeE/YedE family protein [Pseudoduganella sp. FT26W]|uniref:YeeE/YedE family protein n=1 Tax=Duganella aquatilis TaxID=2666082 RepID=A0A844DF95_9BURK|nr:YeeE/YedE family protein [Duganella aquatilis]
MIISFLAGLIFGIGLIISGMANPAKVLAFLDLAGNWNPSLIFVMAGAVGVGFFAFLWARSRKTTLLGGAMKLPVAARIDRRLIIGAVMFGIGWGLAGFCPGPALVGLGMGVPKAILFVLAMVAGMGLYELFERRRGG